VIKLVTHEEPDADAIVGVWLMKRNLQQRNYKGRIEIAFVPAGKTLKGMQVDSDRNVVHIDTGGGWADHHDKYNPTVCAATKIARSIGIADDPRYARIIQMALDDDTNAPRHFGDLRSLIHCWNTEHKSDQVMRMGLKNLNLLYYQECTKVAAAKEFKRTAVWHKTPAGSLCVLQTTRDLLRFTRAFAEKNGAVVLVSRNTDSDYAGVFRLRTPKGSKPIRLVPTAAAIRKTEAERRGLTLSNEALRATGLTEGMGWFLHASLNLFVCGTPKSPLPSELKTVLSLEEITQIVKDDLTTRYRSRTQN